MPTKQRIDWLASRGLTFLLGAVVGTAGVLPSIARQAPAPQAGVANPQEHALDANLYMQTAAEYHAACLQTYGWATERLRSKLVAFQSPGKRPAVVLDLDETVFDNSGFQSFLDRERRDYSDPLWETWERDFPEEVRPVPGAKAFIAAAEQMGVVVVYLSNRLVKYRDSTVAALKHLGLNTEGLEERLLLKDQSSDKTTRRRLAEQRYQVLLYVGDNLRDFSEEFVAPRLAPQDEAAQRQAILDRYAQVRKAGYHWGTDWIILPNPVYGEWQRLLGPDPRQKLRPTQMKPPANR